MGRELPETKGVVPKPKVHFSSVALNDDYPVVDESPKRMFKKKELPEHILRILCIMWMNSHTRAAKHKQYSTENDTYNEVKKWLEAHS
jgi:hypothetical protein